jgi:hypothetical protein
LDYISEVSVHSKWVLCFWAYCEVVHLGGIEYSTQGSQRRERYRKGPEQDTASRAYYFQWCTSSNQASLAKISTSPQIEPLTRDLVFNT